MKKVDLQFNNILDLADFLSIIPRHNYLVDQHRLTISGYFDEADIELARAGYKATVVEISE